MRVKLRFVQVVLTDVAWNLWPLAITAVAATMAADNADDFHGKAVAAISVTWLGVVLELVWLANRQRAKDQFNKWMSQAKVLAGEDDDENLWKG